MQRELCTNIVSMYMYVLGHVRSTIENQLLIKIVIILLIRAGINYAQNQLTV